MAAGSDRAEVENTSCGSGSRYGSSRDTSGGFFKRASSPHGCPGVSLVPTPWLNNAGKLTLLTGLFHSLRQEEEEEGGLLGKGHSSLPSPRPPSPSNSDPPPHPCWFIEHGDQQQLRACRKDQRVIWV